MSERNAEWLASGVAQLDVVPLDCRSCVLWGFRGLS